MGAEPDYRVAIVGEDGQPDMTVAVIDGITGLSPSEGDLLVFTGGRWTDADAAAVRSVLDLGTAAIEDKVAAGSAGVLSATDPTTTNTRTPSDGTTTVAKLASSLVDNLYPWLINLDVYLTPSANTNFDSNVQSSAVIGAGYRLSSGAQNDEIAWDVPLAAGTWVFELMHVKTSNVGIYSVQFDDVEKGTIDGYNGTQQNNIRSLITGITVATTGKVRVKLKMTSKNASSSSYFGIIQAAKLRRTA